MIMGLHQLTMVYEQLTNLGVYKNSTPRESLTLLVDYIVDGLINLRLMISLYTRNHQDLLGNIIVLGNYIIPNIKLLESSILYVLHQLEVSFLCIFSPSCVSFLYLLCLHQI